MTLRPLPLLAGVATLLLLMMRLSGAMWSDTVDLAHHYALVARLTEHWTLPGVADPSLGEMNLYPRLAHGLAAMLGQLSGSPLLGMQWTAVAAWLTIWTVLIVMLLQLPARAAAPAATILAALLLLNHYVLRLELHGAELMVNFFFSQIVGQAFVLLAMLAALCLERGGQPRLWRYALLLAAIRVACGIHLLPAVELLAALGVSAALDLLPALRGLPAGARARAELLAVLLAPLAGAALVYTHPDYGTMVSISVNNGRMPTAYLATLPAFAGYALAVLLLAALLLWRWRSLADARPSGAALGMKYIGLYGMACAGMCLLQLLALRLGWGSEYAVRKYVFALHSAMLVQLSLLPALWLSGARPSPASGAAPGWERRWAGAGWLAMPPLLAMATLGTRPPAALSTAALVRIEQQLMLLRDLGQAPAAAPRHTFVAGLPGVSPNGAYMFSIGLFGAPRVAYIDAIVHGELPHSLGLIGRVLSGPDTAYARYPGCARPGTRAVPLIVDGACIDQALHPAGSHIGLGLGDGEPACELSGLAAPEDYGRWTAQTAAAISCAVPLLHGQRARQLTLDTHAFVNGGPQRLAIGFDGQPPARYEYNQAVSARLLQLPIPPDAQARGRFLLRLALPDARSPQSLGLGPDARQLGLMISAIDFN